MYVYCVIKWQDVFSSFMISVHLILIYLTYFQIESSGSTEINQNRLVIILFKNLK